MTRKGKVGIVRVERVNGEFYLAHKNPANDADISFEARGLLTYLFAKPPDWKCNVPDLIKQSPAGRDKVYSILSELVDFFYIHRQQEILDNGKFGSMIYTVYEYPPLHPDFEPEKATRIWQEHVGYFPETASGFSVNGSHEKAASGFAVYGKARRFNKNDIDTKNEKDNKTDVGVADETLFPSSAKCDQCGESFRIGELVSLPGKVHEGKEYCVTCRDIHEIMDAWRAAYPHGGKYKKAHPTFSRYRKKFETRLKNPSWKKTCLEGIRVASGNLAMSTENWFKLEWLLRNDENAGRAADDEWAWKHKKYLKQGAATDGKDFESVWVSLSQKLSAYRPDRVPTVDNPAEKHIVDTLGWTALSGMSSFDAKHAARAKWQDFQTAGALSRVAVSVTDF